MSEYFNQNYSPNDRPNFDLTNTLSMEINNAYISDETSQRNLENVNTGIATLFNEKNKNESINAKLFQKKSVLFKSSKSNLGRKRKFSKEKGKHTKYDGDNIIRKIKSLLIKNLINVINKLIVSIYDGKIGFGPSTKKILTINQKQIIQCKYDKNFLNKTLKDILSYEITGRISNYNPDHNKNIIELLLNEEDETKRKKFEEFFNLRFIDCISHYSGKIHEPILFGIETLEETCDEMKMKGEDDDYINIFSYFVENFEEKIIAKKNRNPKNKKID